MKRTKYRYSVITLLTALIIVFSYSCEREMEGMDPAGFPTEGEVFIDGFSTGLGYEAWGDVSAFEVDKEISYSGEASMRFAVPDEGETGGYAGGRFVASIPRDLSGYDALTFWAKASKDASIDKIGFGNNAEGSKYLATINGLKVNTNWKKFIIPLPDPAKLTKENGMFYYTEAPEDGSGYTFWIDEVKFEKLGTLAHQQPEILNGEGQLSKTFNGINIPIVGLNFIANLPNGVNQAIEVAPSYFTFSSSDGNVASVDEDGMVTVLGAGAAVIKGSVADAEAAGYLTVESAGEFVSAPEPTADPENVISLFSDAYTNAQVEYYNGYWQPYQTTLSADFEVAGNHVLNYTNLNFVGIQFSAPTINASDMTHLHLDIFIPNEVNAEDKLFVKLVSLGADGTFDDPNPSISTTLASPTLVSQEWISLDLDLSGLTSKGNLAQIVFENLGSPLSSFYVDNIYFYNDGGGTGGDEPTEAAPTPTHDAANVLSIYGDAYTNLEGTDYPDWGQTTVVSDVTIAGENTLKLANLNFQGIQLASSQNVSGMEYLHIDYWSANSASLNTFLISSGPVEKANAMAVPTTGWMSVDIPLSDFSPVDLTDIIQFKFDGNGDIYLDNIYFYKESGGTSTAPTVAAPTPTQDAANVTSIYSDEYTGISGTDFNPGWGQATVYSEVPVAGNNTMLYTNFDFQGIDFSTNKIDATEMTNFHMDIWTPNEVLDKVFTIKCVDFGGGAAEASNFILTVTHTENGNIPALATGTWVSIDVPISDFSGDLTKTDLAQIVTSGSISDVYIDNIYFYKAGGGAATAPTVAAPTPTQDAANVTSIYSDEYTGISGTNFNPGWGQTTVYSEVPVAGNNTMLYTSFDFQGIDFSTNKFDASEMTNFHMDIWTPNEVLDKVFTVKIVDFGGGAAEASNFILTVTHTANGNIPALATGSWVSIDVPISDFSGDLTKTDLAQIVTSGSLSDVYIDNIYFYKTGGGITECSGETVQSLSAADFKLTFMSDPTASIISDGAGFEWVDNPDFDNGVNSSCKVGKITKSGQFAWDNNQINLDAKLDFNANTGLKIKVWSARANTEVRIKLEEIGNAGNNAEQFKTTSVTSGWEELTFPFTSAESDKFDKIVIFFDLNANNTDTYYFDDLMLYSAGGGGTGGDCTPPEGDFISNGGFETGNTDCWLFFDNGGTTSVTNIENNGGTYSAKITTAPQKNPGIKHERFGVGTIQPNQQLEVKFDSKVESLVDGAIVNVLAFSESSTEGVAAVLHNLGTIDVTPGSWNANTLNFTTAGDVSGGVSLLIEVVCGGAASCSGVVYFDNVSVKVAN